MRYDYAKPKTTATLIYKNILFLFQQAFNLQCVLFHSSSYCKNAILHNSSYVDKQYLKFNLLTQFFL